jgi:hypothetical protein
MIKIRYSAVDGFSKRKSFKTLKGARKYAQEMVGKYPSFGSYYAVSDDGVGKIEVIGGVKLRDLFGDEPKPPVEDDYAAEARMEGEFFEGCEPPGFDSPSRVDDYKSGGAAEMDDDIPF